VDAFSCDRPCAVGRTGSASAMCAVRRHSIRANNASHEARAMCSDANVGLPHRSTAIHLTVHLARLDATRVVIEVVGWG
jgi:hypothetical protein